MGKLQQTNFYLFIGFQWGAACEHYQAFFTQTLVHCKCRYQFFAGLFRNRTSNRYFPWKKLSYTQKKGGSGPLLYCCCGSVPTIFSSNASNDQVKCLLEALFPGIRPVTFAVPYHFESKRIFWFCGLRQLKWNCNNFQQEHCKANEHSWEI